MIRNLHIVITGVVFFLIGLVGLGITAVQKDKEQRGWVPSNLNSSRHEDELLSRFENQSNLSPDEQLELLHESSKYSTDWKEEYQKRLKADLDELAVSAEQGDHNNIAGAVYGDNWQEQVEEHMRKKERSELMLNASVMSFLGGAGILVLTAYRWLVSTVGKWQSRRNQIKKKISDLISHQKRQLEKICNREKQTEKNCDGERQTEKNLGMKMLLATQAGNDVKEDELEQLANEQTPRSSKDIASGARG